MVAAYSCFKLRRGFLSHLWDSKGQEGFSNSFMLPFTSEFPIRIVYTALFFFSFFFPPEIVFLVVTEVAEAPGRGSSHAVCSVIT